MREIKFSYIWSNGKEFMDLRHTLYQIEFGLNVTVLDDILSDYKVIARRQYTGLKDKNGVEIYEGDFIDNGYGNIGIVKFGEYQKAEGSPQGWYVEWPCGTQGYLNTSWDQGNIIGNIYENPEMLESV